MTQNNLPESESQSARPPDGGPLAYDRCWLITWTCYGNWLPGDERGFVSRVNDRRDNDPISNTRVIHNVPGSECDRNIPEMKRLAIENMKGDVVKLDVELAKLLLQQFQETAKFRGWTLLAVAIMSNHIHLVCGFPGDPAPDRCMGDFKAYGSRTLNQHFGKRIWWTDKGSQRKLPDDTAVESAIVYVRNQAFPLVVWVRGDLASGELASGPP